MFLPLLLFCAYGIIESLGYDDTNLELSAEKPLDILYSLRRMESRYGSVYQLAGEFEAALETFQRNGWPNSSDYLEFSFKYYQFLSDLESELSNDKNLVTRHRLESQSYLTACQDKRVKRLPVSELIKFRDDYHVHGRINGVDTYPRSKVISKEKAKVFCDVIVRAFKLPSYSRTSQNDETLRIYGDYVLLSDVVRIMSREDDRYIRTVEIFASIKFTIDTDFVFVSAEPLNIIIMSGVWTVPKCDELHKKLHNDIDCARLIKIKSQKSGSLFFGTGYQFAYVDRRLTIKIRPKPSSHNYLTVYQLVEPSETKLVITDFGKRFKEPNPAETGYNYHELMNSYIGFLLKKERNEVAAYYLTRLYGYPNFKPRMFNTFGFVQELFTLEDYFLSMYHKGISPNVVYKGLNKRFDDYTLSLQPNEISLEFNELRNSIRTAIWSKIDVIASKDDFELDLVKYITDGVSNSIKMGDIIKREKGKQIMLFKEDMKTKIVASIRQAQAFNRDEVIPKVNELNEQVDLQLDNVLRAAVAIREKVVEDVEKREAQEAKLRFFRFVKSVTTLIAAVASLFSGPGAIAFVVLGTVTGSALEIIGEPEVDEVKVPGSIRNVENFIESKSRVFDHMLNILGNNEPRLLGSLKKEIKNTQEAMKEGNDVAPFEKIKKLLETKENELKASSGASGSSKALGIVKQLQKILKLSQVASPDAYLKYRNDTTAIQVLDESSGVNDDDDVKAAILYERQIHSLIAPAIRYFNNFTAGLANSTSDKSQAEIDVWKWKANDILRDIHFRVREFTSSMYEGKTLLETIDKLSSALNLVFDLTDRVRVYEQCAQLVGFIGDVNSVQFRTREYENKEIEEAISKLQYFAKYNTAIARYKKTLNSYKLYAFPFTTMLSGLLNFHFTEEYSQIHSVKDMAMNAEMQLGSMGLRMNRYKNSLTDHQDIDILEGRFDGSPPNREVFYTWNLARSSSELEGLFSGEEVIFNADVTRSLQKNAMKFKRIGIRFETVSPRMQGRLDNALESFEVTMTHSGESHYRCDNKFYKATSGSMTVRFSIAKDASGEPAIRGDAYKKLVNGNYLLSPYTVWKIRLESNDGNFTKLKNLSNLAVKVILEGDGQYVKGRDACSNDLHRYYTVVN